MTNSTIIINKQRAAAADDPELQALWSEMQRLIRAIMRAAFADRGLTTEERALRLRLASREFERAAAEIEEDRRDNRTTH